MAESTLSIGLSDLQFEVGRFLGFGTSSGDWSTAESDAIDRCVQSGVRQFYFPPEIGVEGIAGHQWRFLTPNTSMDTTADDADQDMPDDFGRVIGLITFSPESHYSPIRVVSEGSLLAMRQRDTNASIPVYAAFRYKASDGSAGQRQEVMFYPVPDDAYTLYYSYEAFTGKLTASYPYPLGGMKYAEVITESCLAVAELRLNDEYGVHWEAFKRNLIAAVTMDKKGSARYFGAMGDPEIESSVSRRHFGSSYEITYKGEIL